MENFTLGAGLASLAFWGFIAAVVVAGIWYDMRNKAEKQKTIQQREAEKRVATRRRN